MYRRILKPSKPFAMKRHIEFFDRAHFENHYLRVLPPPDLRPYIDFFWETDFDPIWNDYPDGFSDALFPNLGYTYLINLGNTFTMQAGKETSVLKTDSLLPRYNGVECFHKPGNHLFGIKFRVTPVLLERKINFSEYQGYVFPLSYLLNPDIIAAVKKAGRFAERVAILSDYFSTILEAYSGAQHPVHIIAGVLHTAYKENNFAPSLPGIAEKYKISGRTLQRYFEACTGTSSKKALQVIRIRKATEHLIKSPATFSHLAYGYYDYSHFYKHFKQFLSENTFDNKKLHLPLLKGLQKKAGVEEMAG